MSRCVSKDGIPCVICAPMILARSQGPALIEVPFPPDCAFEPHADSSEMKPQAAKPEGNQGP